MPGATEDDTAGLDARLADLGTGDAAIAVAATRLPIMPRLASIRARQSAKRRVLRALSFIMVRPLFSARFFQAA